jgi:pre-mRNA-splicing factor ISY1
MARNEEKALSALNRWVGQKRDLERATNVGSKGIYMGGALPDQADFGPYAAKKRPKFAGEVSSAKEAEIWRSEIVRGITKKIAEIQNAALGEHRLRDLNDEINKDIREKGHWEDQIKSLGGPDYKAQKSHESVAGAELSSHTGYKYFGAAKDLPGVRELFETEVVPEAPRKTRKQLFKNIAPDYYGWRDEEDGMLLLAEQQKEMEAVAQEVSRWKAEQANKPKKADKPGETAKHAPVPEKLKEAPVVAEPASTRTLDFKSYVDVPTMEEIEKLIIQKKKKALLAKYASADQQKQNNESSTLVSGKS